MDASLHRACDWLAWHPRTCAFLVVGTFIAALVASAVMP